MPRQSEIPDQPPQTTLAQDLMTLGRYGLGSRTGKLLIGAGIVASGLFLGWDWLVAAGLAPVVLGVLPCVAMCAAGLCMNCGGGKSCSSTTSDTGNTEAITQAKSSVAANDPEPIREIEKE